VVITKYHEVQSTNTAQICFSKKKRKKRTQAVIKMTTQTYEQYNSSRLYKWKEKGKNITMFEQLQNQIDKRKRQNQYI